MEGLVEEASRSEELDELPLPRLVEEVQGPTVAAPRAARAKVQLMKFEVFTFDSDDSD